MNCFVNKSISCVVSASEPPGESFMRARLYVPRLSCNTVDPCQTHVDAVSVVGGGNASKSRTVSHSGWSERYESNVVFLQIP